MNDYQEILNAHPLWEKNRHRWQMLWESYVGGEIYKSGGYLARYQYETPNEYDERIKNTPLDNHCKGVIDVYNSFLFRESPDREFGTIGSDPGLEPFLKDADLEGRSFDVFMKDVSTYAAIFGHAWVIVSKPQTNAGTRAAELEQGVRPYVSMVSPVNVLDWEWTRQSNGYYALTYLKYIEDESRGVITLKEWDTEYITTTILDQHRREVKDKMIEDNQLGQIPAVIVYAARSEHRGIGVSAVNDIADLQKAIYNEYSEVEQLVRLANHPALVKTSDVEAVAGAGAIIQMPDTLDPGLKPYLLQPSGSNLSEVYASIRQKIEAIDRIAHLGSVRATQATTRSGISMEVEFQQLNARLSEIADNLEVGEEQIWRLWALYQGKAWSGEINYPNSFNIRDKGNEFQQLTMAKQAATDPRVLAVVDHELVELLGENADEILPEAYASPDDVFEPHTMIDPATGERYPANTPQDHERMAALGYIHADEE